MKILLTNHQLKRYAGTEVFTYTIAKALKQRGHQVTVYSAYVGAIRQLFYDINVPLVDNIRYLQGDFDVAHVHHNINAYEVRNRYPSLPIVFVSHGVLYNLEFPPVVNLGISKYLAVSEEVRSNLITLGIPENDVGNIRNPVDEDIFYSTHPINPIPKKALVISNKIDTVTEEIIRQACSELSIECNLIGFRFNHVPNDKLPEYIRQSDIVFSLSRGVIEAMFCGRVPIQLDYLGGEGMVTPENFHELIKNNFSENRNAKKFSVQELICEIQKYQQQDGERLRKLAISEFSLPKQIDKLIRIYTQCMQNKIPEISQKDKLITAQFCEAIKLTRRQSRFLPKEATREGVIFELGGNASFKVFRILGRLRYILVPIGSKRESFLLKLVSKQSTTHN